MSSFLPRLALSIVLSPSSTATAGPRDGEGTRHEQEEEEEEEETASGKDVGNEDALASEEAEDATVENPDPARGGEGR